MITSSPYHIWRGHLYVADNLTDCVYFSFEMVIIVFRNNTKVVLGSAGFYVQVSQKYSPSSILRGTLKSSQVSASFAYTFLHQNGYNLIQSSLILCTDCVYFKGTV